MEALGLREGRAGRRELSQLMASLRMSPPVRSSRFEQVVSMLNTVSDLLEYNWPELPDEVKDTVRLGFYESRDRKLTIWERARFVVSAIRYGHDPTVWNEYVRSVNHLEDVLYDLFERDNPRYAESLDSALSDLTETSRLSSNPTTVEDWSAWLRKL